MRLTGHETVDTAPIPCQKKALPAMQFSHPCWPLTEALEARPGDLLSVDQFSSFLSSGEDGIAAL